MTGDHGEKIAGLTMAGPMAPAVVLEVFSGPRGSVDLTLRPVGLETGYLQRSLNRFDAIRLGIINKGEVLEYTPALIWRRVTA